MKKTILDYFLKYVKMDSHSILDTNTTPSNKDEFIIAQMLKDELVNLGLENVYIDDYCFVKGYLPANCDTKLTIGFLAHMDTIPELSGKVTPKVIESYDGKDIILNDSLTIETDVFPFLKNMVGDTLITTSGDSVLGADDKAGIANILAMLTYFKNNPDVKHCNIRISFTPDEEIGEGIEKFNLSDFKCDYAFTVDGELYNEICYENFNASSAKVTITGFDIHPGTAYNTMKNASLIAMEFNSLLDPYMVPSKTQGYEGFNHLCDITGSVGKAEMFYILRNHNLDLLKKQEKCFIRAAKHINSKYGNNTCNVEIKESYKNMYEIIKNNPECVTRAKKAIEAIGAVPNVTPIRGGTDGARLTYMGLNTPNLGTGGYNPHGPYELANLEEMEKVVNILINIAKQD